MNALSWLLYLADVADNLDSLLWWTAFFGMAGLVLWAIVGFCAIDEFDETDWKSWRRATYVLIPLVLFGWVVGAIVPSKNTVYAIAASEMGERAINTATGNKAFRALDAWLDKQIDDKPADKSSDKNASSNSN